jgi:hypothetical protein
MERKPYNGYTNYETWLVALWLDNDQRLYALVREDVDSETENYELASRIECIVQEMTDGLVVLIADLVSSAVSEVDWSDIARVILSEIEPENTESEE